MIGALVSAAASAPQTLAGFISGPWPKVAAVVAALCIAAALWIWIAQLKGDNADLRLERGRLHHELAIHKRLLLERERALAALAEAEREAALKRRVAERAREEVRHAPRRENGAVAPVLRRALERLR